MNDAIKAQAEKNTFIICSGSVSMGDKDFLKPVLNELGFETHFGRVNMKPGFVNLFTLHSNYISRFEIFQIIFRKPMTFASRKQSERKCFLFGLPGNPVSVYHQMSSNNLSCMNKNLKNLKNDQIPL